MDLFLKRFTDFATIGRRSVLASSLCLDSAETANSTVTVVGSDVPRSAAGAWAVVDGLLYTVAQVTPQDGRTLLTLQDPIEVFSRLIPYEAPASGVSSGQFVTDMIVAHWILQTDAVYAIPYLTVSNLDHGEFIEPAVDENGLFSLSAYLRLLRRMVGICARSSFAGDRMTLTLQHVPPSPRNVVFDDGHSQLSSVAYSDSGLAKITTRQPLPVIEGYDENDKPVYAKDDDGATVYVVESIDWYLTEAGAVVTTPPAHRVPGAWITLPVSTRDSAEVKAAQRFAKAASSYKIEFWSDRELELFDPCRFRIYGETLDSYISAKIRLSTDSRWFYRSGELATTATEKLRGVI